MKKYWDGEAVPWVRKEYQRPTSVLAEGVKSFIQHCLEEDEENGLRKQSHTAKRIYDRLVEEQSFTGGESTVRRYVQELRSSTPEAFVPMAFEAGDASRRLGGLLKAQFLRVTARGGQYGTAERFATKTLRTVPKTHNSWQKRHS